MSSADPEQAKATEGQEDREEALKEDFQSLREIITEEGGPKDTEDEDDDDETCGFCRFMKAGGCRAEFTAWSACVDANRGEGHNFTEECRDATLALQGCMEQHRDYYKDFMLEPDLEDKGAGGGEAGTDGADGAPSEAPKEDGDEASGAGGGAIAAQEAEEEQQYAPQPQTIGNVNLDDEPLPPAETLLSGLEGKFQAQKGGEEEPEEAQEDDGGEGGKGEGEGKEEEAAEKPVIELKTSAYDARFPSTNQARHCYTRYNEYHRCVAERGEDAPECSVFQRAYRSLCPSEWLERWNEQREEGTWPGRY